MTDWIEKMRTLIRSHPDVSFTFNPGGGEFYSAKRGRCQIYDMLGSEEEDYNKVKDWLASESAL